MEIIEKRLTELTPYKNNPRKNDQAVDAVAASIKAFGFKVPIVIDSDGVIVCGHTRVKAAKKLKLESVPCVVADDLTEEEIKAFRLADNRVAEQARWDVDLLGEELSGIFDIDMSDFGFDADENEGDTKYTPKVEIPDYTVTNNSVNLSDCINKAKYNVLIEEIMQSKVSQEEKNFLILAAARHILFNYKNIAGYYAGASKEMQELMERSALVIIDYENAIQNGYVRLKGDIMGALEDALQEEI